MNIWHLITREITFRKLNFLLATLAVIVAVSTVVASITTLDVNAQATDTLIAKQQEKNDRRLEQERKETLERLEADEKRTKKELKDLQTTIRKTMLKLKFNVWIVSKQEDLGNLSAESLAVSTLPDSHAKKIANSRIREINHLLPQVQRRTAWTEKGDYELYVIGIEREVPFAHRTPKKDILPAVPKGTVIVGHAIREKFQLEQGQKIQFRGKEFTIAQFFTERGSRDDKSIFMNLREAQDLYDMKDKDGNYLVNAILALNCNCSDVDQLNGVRTAILKILPDVQVQMKMDAATARAVARTETQKTAIREVQRRKAEAKKALAEQKRQQDAELEETRQDRENLRSNYEWIATILLPLAILASTLWLGFTMLNNVRERTSEIGILRALGLSSASVHTLFLTRAILIGILGGVVGYLLGIAGGLTGVLLTDPSHVAVSSANFLNTILIVGVLVAAPLLSALVTWLSATVASQQDPAVILSGA